MNLRELTISSLAEVFSGGGAPQERETFSDKGHPFVRAGSLDRLLNGGSEQSLEKLEPQVAEGYGLRLFPAGTVLFAKSGMSATKGFVYRLRLAAYVVSHLAALIPREPRDSAFLVRALQRFSPTTLIKDAAYPSIRLGDIEAMKIISPDQPAERWRIAEVLDRADALRVKRRAVLAQLDTLVQAIFVDMFGDPAGKGWARTNIAGVAKPVRGSIRTGPFGSQLLHSEFTDTGIAVLGIDNAVDDEFRWAERRYITEAKYRELKRYTVHAGDVLITIMGTCGRCAVVPEDIPTAINTKHLCCITLDPTKCIPVFLHAYFLQHPIARRYLTQSAKGAIMSGLNMGIIKEMPMALPPIELQHEFARRIGTVEKLKAAHRASFTELNTLFASLQHRAFHGAL